MTGMKVAVDSSAIFAVLKGEADHEEWLNLMIRLAREGVQLVACDVVWAEIAGFYVEEWKLRKDMADFEIHFDALDLATCFTAGRMFKAFKQNSTCSRIRILPDFLIGAHALKQTQGLITSDRGYMRTHFQDLRIIEP